MNEHGSTFPATSPPMKRIFEGVLLAGLLLAVSGPSAGSLPRPAGLETEIGFWREVFAEATTGDVLIHDSRHLDVVYQRVSVSPGTPDSKRRKLVAEAERRYAGILRRLAEGGRRALSAEERRVLALWPADVSNAELREAAGRVRSQGGLADRFREGLARSGRWRPHIEEQLERAGVPSALSALPHVESSFNPAAGSHAGAVGLWQFTAGTGRRFMQVDHVVDERRDPFRSSEAAARLLRANFRELGTWPLAITAYNHGSAGMRRAVRTVGTKDIEAIVRRYNGPAFGFASRNFYVSLLAALDAEQRYADLPREEAEPQHVLVLPHYVRAQSLEATLGVPREVLRAYNPALLEPVWQGQKYVPRGYVLRLPASLVDSPEARLAALDSRDRFASQVPDRTHRVRGGESLSVIARRYGTSTAALARLNGLSGRYLIRAGQELRLPGGAVATGEAPSRAAAGSYVVRRGDTLGAVARRAGVPARELMALNNLKDPNRLSVGQTLKLRPALRPLEGLYTVKRGDSLASIAKRTGVSQRELLALNELGNPNRIYPGQKLRLAAPDGG